MVFTTLVPWGLEFTDRIVEISGYFIVVPPCGLQHLSMRRPPDPGQRPSPRRNPKSASETSISSLLKTGVAPPSVLRFELAERVVLVFDSVKAFAKAKSQLPPRPRLLRRSRLGRDSDGSLHMGDSVKDCYLPWGRVWC